MDGIPHQIGCTGAEQVAAGKTYLPGGLGDLRDLPDNCARARAWKLLQMMKQKRVWMISSASAEVVAHLGQAPYRVMCLSRSYGEN